MPSIVTTTLLLGATLGAAQETAPPAAATGVPAEIQAIQSHIAQQVRDGKINKEALDWRVRVPRFPEVTFTGQEYFWHLKTNLGEMKLVFFPDAAPNHVANFMYLSSLGYFDGLTFHRVLKGFMAQGGCPLGDGTGGPGYQFGGELEKGLQHDRAGLLSMANRGPGTDGSQFFITLDAARHLDDEKKHTIFGELVEGMDVLREIEKRGQESGSGTPTEPITIERAYVTPGRTAEELAIAFIEDQSVDVSKGVKTPSGLWYVDTVAGTGVSPEPKAEITAHYTMWIGTEKFASSRFRNTPFTAPLEDLIPGWKQGIATMKPGGKRYLVVPTKLGYGEKGVPAYRIPGQATLVFEVELISFEAGS